MAKTSAPKNFDTFSETSIPDYDSFTTKKAYYRVNGEKTEGGQSYIFPCINNNENRYVVKVYKTKSTPSNTQIKLAETISEKSISHILPIIDSGITDDKKYFFQVMPYMCPILEYNIDTTKILLRVISDLL